MVTIMLPGAAQPQVSSTFSMALLLAVALTAQRLETPRLPGLCHLAFCGGGQGKGDYATWPQRGQGKV